MSLSIDLIQKSIMVIVISLSLILGIAVLYSNKKSKTNIYYCLSAILIVFWVLFGYLVYYQPMVDYRLIIGRLNLCSVAFFFVTIYGFVRNFPKENKSFKLFDVIYMGLGIVLAVITVISGFIVKDIQVNGTERIWTFGNFIIEYYAYALTTTALVIIGLIKKYLTDTDLIERSKIKAFFYGLGLLSLLNIVFNIIYPYLLSNYDYYFLGDSSVIFVLIFTAYAIIKHRMFNIKIVATESIVIALSLVLLIEVYLSNDYSEGAIKLVIWLLATYGGYQLIRSVKKEIEQRKQIQKLADDLKVANEHLKDLDKLKDDFLSMAAHELNTPLAAITGYLSMILEENIGGEVNPKIKKYLENMFVSSKRLTLLVKDMLNVSRIESGRIHLIYVDTPIESVIEQAIAEIGSKAKERNHSLIFHKPKTKMPHTWFDASRITEVLINIIGNAIKYTDTGGKIEVFVKNDDKFITVSVKDNGRGIPEDRKKSVFEKFTQVDILKDEVKGTGLGMYIAKKFIELLGGKIWFDSEEGKGSTFYFTLPLLKDKPRDPHEGEGEVLH